MPKKQRVIAIKGRLKRHSLAAHILLAEAFYLAVSVTRHLSFLVILVHCLLGLKESELIDHRDLNL